MRLVRENLRTNEARQVYDMLATFIRLHDGANRHIELADSVVRDSHADEIQIMVAPETGNMLVRSVRYKSEPERIVRMLNNPEPCSAWSVDKDIQQSNCWYTVEEKKSD